MMSDTPMFTYNLGMSEYTVSHVDLSCLICFSIHDYLAFQGVGALEQKCGVFQQGKVQNIGYVVPMFGTACRPLKLNVAVEVSWLSTCLHCVIFFGESNT